MRRVRRQVDKAELRQTIVKKFGHLSNLVALSGAEITPEVEEWLTQVQNDREPVQLRIQYKSASIVIDIV